MGLNRLHLNVLFEVENIDESGITVPFVGFDVFSMAFHHDDVCGYRENDKHDEHGPRIKSLCLEDNPFEFECNQWFEDVFEVFHEHERLDFLDARNRFEAANCENRCESACVH